MEVYGIVYTLLWESHIPVMCASGITLTFYCAGKLEETLT